LASVVDVPSGRERGTDDLSNNEASSLRLVRWHGASVVGILGSAFGPNYLSPVDGKTAAQVSERDGDVSTTLRLTRGSGVDVL
jgi:hypothetical protein